MSVERLSGVEADSWGDGYRSAILEQYKLLVEMADRISQRRHWANTFLLTANSALLAVTGFVETKGDALEPMVAGAGIALSVVWFLLIQSYRHLNEAKFEVIKSIEQGYLPLTPYVAETAKLEVLRKHVYHWSLSTVERAVPLIFGALYVMALVVQLQGD